MRNGERKRNEIGGRRRCSNERKKERKKGRKEGRKEGRKKEERKKKIEKGRMIKQSKNTRPIAISRFKQSATNGRTDRPTNLLTKLLIELPARD